LRARRQESYDAKERGQLTAQEVRDREGRTNLVRHHCLQQFRGRIPLQSDLVDPRAQLLRQLRIRSRFHLDRLFQSLVIRLELDRLVVVAVDVRADDDNASLGEVHSREEDGGEEEVGEVVDCDGRFEVVLGEGGRRGGEVLHRGGLHERLNGRKSTGLDPRRQLLPHLPHRSEVSQIERDVLDIGGGRREDVVGDCGGVADEEDEVNSRGQGSNEFLDGESGHSPCCPGDDDGSAHGGCWVTGGGWKEGWGRKGSDKFGRERSTSAQSGAEGLAGKRASFVEMLLQRSTSVKEAKGEADKLDEVAEAVGAS
jgi:hypothetical protein